jgi:putative hydroxymethylpyrimidine transport system ATP-binding protein
MPLPMNSYPNKKEVPFISVSHLFKDFMDKEVLKDISLKVFKGELVSILGPSGCGKSTLFNIIAGLIPQDQGEVTGNRNLGYMIQKDLLLPWKTITENVVLPLDLKGFSKKESRKKARETMSMMGLEGFEEKYPHQLSGGMKQRANFLRTFLSSNEGMLLDEPFGSLDSITKGNMQRWLLDMIDALKTTILFITHDIDEAILLSNRIYVMSNRPGTIKAEFSLEFHKENKRERLQSVEALTIKEKILESL